MRILITEDDLTSLNMLTAVLKKAGYEVVETVDGAEAWDAMQRPGAPKLAILDWMMPEMDGLEVLRRVHAVKTKQPPYILMLTVRDEKTNIISGLDAGAGDYLAKPYDTCELLARVEIGRRIVEMQDRPAAQILKPRQALDDAKTLQGILPICSFCKKIRDDQGHLDQVEAYVGKHSNAKFSHGICPKCAKKHYPEYYRDDTVDDYGEKGAA